MNDEVLLYNEETLTKLKMTWNKTIDDVLKRVFEKAISQKKEKWIDDYNHISESEEKKKA